MNHTLPLWLVGLALGALLALFIAPQTRWLARVQWASSLNLYHPFPWCAPDINSYTLTLREDRAREETVAARHPDDFPIQLAVTSLGITSHEQQITRLRTLKSRFPNSASLDANAIRYACLSGDWLDRDENYLMSGQPVPKPPYYTPPPPTAAQLAAFDRDCADGERLDPDNAFFPLMRAVGLFTAHRDAEARAAVVRAGTKTQWKEYLADEPTGQWRLHDEAFGDPNALWRTQVMASVLLPEYARIRAVARVATYQAILAEQSGHLEDGLAIRRALMRCGGLMRAQSTLVIGSLVGIAITHIAMARPGGAPAAHYPPQTFSEPGAHIRQLTAAYKAYLHKIGQDGEARWVQSETDAAQQTRAVIGGDWPLTVRSAFSRPFQRLSSLWVADLLVIANILWLLLLGSLAALPRRRSAPAAPGRPLSAPFLWAALALSIECSAAFVIVLVSSVGADSGLGSGLALAGSLIFVVTIGVVVRMAFADKARRDTLARRLRAALFGVLLAALVLGIVIALAHWQTQNVVSVIRLERGILGQSGTDATPTPLDDWLPSLCVTASLAFPLLLVLSSLGVSLARRASALDGLRRGYRAAALPLAALLLLTYGGLTLATARQERAVNDALTRTLVGEGPYWAGLSSQSWPGVTP